MTDWRLKIVHTAHSQIINPNIGMMKKNLPMIAYILHQLRGHSRPNYFFTAILRLAISVHLRNILPAHHHAAFHSGNHQPRLLGLKWSFGNWRQAGNQQQLGKDWCKVDVKKKVCHLCSLGHLVYHCGSAFFSTSFPSMPHFHVMHAVFKKIIHCF